MININFQSKHIKMLSIAFLLLGSLFLSQGVSAQSFLTVDGNREGGPSINRFQIAPKDVISSFSNNPISFFDVTYNLIFRHYGVSALETLFVTDRSSFENMFVGFPNFQSVDSNTPLQVDGKIKIIGLATSDPLAPALAEVCTDDFGKLERCAVSSVVTVPDPTTYSWVEGGWGPCTTAPGTCSGLPRPTDSTVKVDWNGNAFDWEDGRVYRNNNGAPELVTVCATAPSLPYDMTSGENLDYNAANGNVACLTQSPPYTWDARLYEPSASNGNWQQLNITSGTGGDLTSPGNSSTPGWINSVNPLSGSPLYGLGTGVVYRNRCDVNNNGTWADDNFNGTCTTPDGAWENTGISCSPITDNGFLPLPLGINELSTTVNGSSVICYEASSTPIGSCSGTDYASCTGVDGCDWTPGLSTQTQTVTCEDSEGNTVDDQFCIDNVGPKPATIQSCPGSLGTGTPVDGCYPIGYAELLGQYGLAQQVCGLRTTEATCNGGNAYWWSVPRNINEGGSTYPNLSNPPVWSHGVDHAIHSYSNTSNIILDINDLDLTGIALPATDDGVSCAGGTFSCASDQDSSNMFLGPVCIWGGQ